MMTMMMMMMMMMMMAKMTEEGGGDGAVQAYEILCARQEDQSVPEQRQDSAWTRNKHARSSLYGGPRNHKKTRKKRGKEADDDDGEHGEAPGVVHDADEREQ